jgi:hypothetical protein
VEELEFGDDWLLGRAILALERRGAFGLCRLPELVDLEHVMTKLKNQSFGVGTAQSIPAFVALNLC